MTTIPDQTTQDADDLEMLEYEKQDAEDERERAPLNGRHYHDLTVRIATLNVAIARHRADHPTT